ncbi:MAG TPA: cysteine--tRNA ligase [Anaerolineae bacterium]|nr:cysteine--tRNA ligase [Anaerolineae bacterium]
MALKLYNTLTRQKETFVPLEDRQVRMYVCGPNLYGPCHVGHAMSYIFFDVLRRYLEYRGYEVTHVQNFTDIEDRIIETARALGTTVGELAEEHIHRFFAEMDALNIQRAHYYPRATEVIPGMIEIIQGLITKGHAYVVDGDVYFRVASDPDYGKLSGRSLEEMQAGARIEVDPRKEHPMDFALWKAAKPGEPSWDSPWGKGRPGWHIECSAMAIQLLGEQIDIHGGGQDLVFPHHENEIAQSESYTGKVPFARYWVHNGLLRPSEDQEKMTRHLGNFVSCQEALERYHPDAIRLFILSSHYRSPLTWSEEGVLAAERGLERLRVAVREVEVGEGGGGDGLIEVAEEARRGFMEAMDDDLNTARATSHLYELARAINQARDSGLSGQAIVAAQAVLRELAGVFGLTLKEPEAPREAAPFIELLISVRNDLRAARQWALADKIRAELGKLGVILEDGPTGTRWRVR